MKTTLAALSLFLTPAFALSLVASEALAYPAVNDSATYQGFYTEQAQKYPVTLTNALTAFNAQTGQYQQTETQTIAGQTDTKDTWVDGGDLLTPAQVQNLITNCVAQSGSLETIKTPVGVLDTCKLSNRDGDTTQTYWFADVPFGIARFLVDGKSDEGNAYQIALQISALVRGQ
ncbi:MAG: hypothetical protein EOP05_03780 [Proteobacteria bacterium]|nr:MAG: hypothetical protein EOP05_03780 [Pseudomonadota bacterium]